MPEITKEQVVDYIVNMSLLDAAEMVKELEDKLGVSAAAPIMAAAPIAGVAADSPAAEEKTEFDVVLASFGDKKIQVIKVVRALTGLGLKEAKELVDGVPSPVKEGVTKEEADDIKKQLEEVGATVELK